MFSENGGMEALRNRIEEWRNSKPRQRQMPEELWRAAADLAHIHGACRISKALGLGYVGLKNRIVSNFGEIKKGTEANGGGFVELVNLAGCGQMRVEVNRPDGCQLRIEIGAGQGLDAAPVMRAFLE